MRHEALGTVARLPAYCPQAQSLPAALTSASQRIRAGQANGATLCQLSPSSVNRFPWYY